jgi:hypothetical protein
MRDPQTEGELISFRLTDAQKNYNQSRDVNGQLGHPAGMDWFCLRHAAKARLLRDLTLGDALREMHDHQTFSEKMMRFIYKLMIIRR